MVSQAIVFTVLAVMLVLFVTGRWRYDLVVMVALLFLGIAGIIPVGELFAGFSHPAVITVAAVLIASRGLRNAGVVDMIAQRLSQINNRTTIQIGALSGLAALFSSFMNNVGALALLMPVAIRMARRVGKSPSLLLMPLAFASLLGGLTTMIGTPPNIIIATFRAQANTEPFRMFDFAPVGVGIALAGLLFITLVGWRLIPQRTGSASQEELFSVENYISEVLIPGEAKIAGQPLRDLETHGDEDITIIGLARGERRLMAPSPYEVLREGDILIVRADSEALQELIDSHDLELAGDEPLGEEDLKSEDVTIVEAVVGPDSPAVGRSARTLNLRWRHAVNLLAVGRQGHRLRGRLANMRFQAGDILLLQGETDNVYEAVTALGCLPLAERDLRLGHPRRALLAVALFAGGLLTAAVGLLPVQVALTAAATLMVIAGLLSLKEVYESIDWPIIILLGGMIPVGQALERTGGAALIADQILIWSVHLSAPGTLILVMVGTMFLSDLVNNAAAAVLMAPIAIGTAQGLGVSVDPFLMAVAIGASSAFLTPVGHQSNTLVMGPAGYRFSDYWRMGLPLEIVIVVVSIPLILRFWPL
ncbi:MAG: SLC13 family permease [Thermaerobacterales bacterium]